MVPMHYLQELSISTRVLIDGMLMNRRLERWLTGYKARFMMQRFLGSLKFV